jgi:hypothetical protein
MIRIEEIFGEAHSNTKVRTQLILCVVLARPVYILINASSVDETLLNFIGGVIFRLLWDPETPFKFCFDPISPLPIGPLTTICYLNNV